MEKLVEVEVPGFSIGSLLAPSQWTLDVASHHLCHSVTDETDLVGSTVMGCHKLGSMSSVESGEWLPLGSSSNTARFEERSSSGNTVYITELFVPHSGVAPPSVHEGETVITAEKIRSKLEKVAPWRPKFTPLQVWVREIDDAASRGESGRCGCFCSSCTALPMVERPCDFSLELIEYLSPLFRVFIVVVADVMDDIGASVLEGSAQRMMQYVFHQYHLSVSHLPIFLSMYGTGDTPLACQEHQMGSGTAEGTEKNHCSPPEKTELQSTAMTTTAGVSKTGQLRQSCSPYTLARVHWAGLYAAGMYSKCGRAVLQLNLMHPKIRRGDCSWYCEGVTPGVGQGCHKTIAALRCVLEQELCLVWEGLSFMSLAASSSSHQLDEGIVHLAVGAFDLDSSPAATTVSVYNFLSIVDAFERHIRSSLVRQESLEDGRLCQWSLQKIGEATRLPCNTNFSEAWNEAKLPWGSECSLNINPAMALMRRIMLNGTPPVLPPRSSFFGLRLRRTTPGGEDNTEDYLLQLIAPRVLSTHAVVLCMKAELPCCADGDSSTIPAERPFPAKPPLSVTCFSVLPEKPFDLPRMPSGKLHEELTDLCEVAAAVPSLWLPRGEVLHHIGSGLCVRSGQLLLHIPSTDARYAGVRVLPTASKTFTTLGSLTVLIERAVVPPSSLNWRSATDPSPNACPGGGSGESHAALSRLPRMSAFWTLLSDGRSASEYLEDTLSEYLYDTGAKTLHGSYPQSMLEHQVGRFTVHRRLSHKDSSSLARSRGGEWYSVWVKLGASLNLYLYVRESGLGQLLLIEASIVTPAESRVVPVSSECIDDKPSDVKASAPRGNNDEWSMIVMEEWVAGITSSAIPGIGL